MANDPEAAAVDFKAADFDALQCLVCDAADGVMALSRLVQGDGRQQTESERACAFVAQCLRHHIEAANDLLNRVATDGQS